MSRHGTVNGYVTDKCRCRECRNAINTYNRDRYRQDPERWLSQFRKAKRKKQAILDRYKTMKGCERCGFRAHPAALDFDHIDPTRKRMNVGRAIQARGWEYVKQEVRKCRILCANCHRILTPHIGGSRQ